MPYDPRRSVQDTLDFAGAIADEAERGRAAIDEDRRTRALVEYHLVRFGEAANPVPREVQAMASAVPWPGIIGLRHVLVHGYDTVDPDRVWAAALSVQAVVPHLARLLASVERRPPA